MEKEIIRALKLFGREDLTDGTYDLPELDSNIETFMTPGQMIYYMNLEIQLKKQKEIIDKAKEELKQGITFCKNDSQGLYDKCNIAINREKKILQILEDKEV